MTKLQKMRIRNFNSSHASMIIGSERNLIKRTVLLAAYLRQQATRLDVIAYIDLAIELKTALLPNTSYCQRVYALAYTVEQNL